MTDVGSLLESERGIERQFVAADRTNPKGWSTALTMFHFIKWRGRIHDALTALRDGRRYTPPPQNVDEFNDAELATASQMSLADSARVADSLLVSLMDLYEAGVGGDAAGAQKNRSDRSRPDASLRRRTLSRHRPLTVASQSER